MHRRDWGSWDEPEKIIVKFWYTGCGGRTSVVWASESWGSDGKEVNCDMLLYEGEE